LDALRLTVSHSIFPSHHIDGVGTLQDAGPLENNPELWARSEVSALFPHCQEPDFVVSLGTGEPGPGNYDVSTEDRRKQGMLSRGWNLIWEKSRDRAVRRAASLIKPASYRLNIEFDGDEPRLDDTSSIPKLVSKVETDAALRPKIDAVARCMVASLFYFELDPLLRVCDSDKYMLTGKILCSVRQNDPALKALLAKLTASGGRFAVNGSPIVGSFLGKDGNFHVRVDVQTFDKLAITLELDEAGACNISGSPFSVQKLVVAQGLHAPFGRSDHRIQKRSDGDSSVPVRVDEKSLDKLAVARKVGEAGVCNARGAPLLARKPVAVQGSDATLGRLDQRKRKRSDSDGNAVAKRIRFAID
jgi:hypothetical protein